MVDGSDCWSQCFDHNVTDLLSLLNNSLDSNISKYIIVGSCFEYGTSGSSFDYIPVTAPLMPTSAYGASKASASVLSLGFAVQNHLDLIIVRPFHVYGAGEDPSRFYPQLVSHALSGTNFDMTGGAQVRDFQEVGDCCDQILQLAMHSESFSNSPRIYNLGTGRPQSLKEFALYCWSHFKSSASINFGALPYRLNEVFRYVPDVNLPFAP